MQSFFVYPNTWTTKKRIVTSLLITSNKVKHNLKRKQTITHRASWFRCSSPGSVPCRRVRSSRTCRRRPATWRGADPVAKRENPPADRWSRSRLGPAHSRWFGRAPWRCRWPPLRGSGWWGTFRRPFVWPVCWILRKKSEKGC